MANSTIQMMTYANNATIITSLSQCDAAVNLTTIVQSLYDLYQTTDSNVFSNVSIIHFDCHTPSGKYFEQILTFTKAVSIHSQIALASIYFDYITANQYSVHGFLINQEEPFNLSSISLNYDAKSDACSSGEAAQDPLCIWNSSTSQCTQSLFNPWIYNCSLNSSTSTMADNTLLSILTSSILNSWQIGLVCGLCFLFFLILFVLIGYLYRRHSRTKRIALSREYLFNDKKSMQKSEIPQDQLFERAVRVVEPKQSINTTVSWIHDGIITDNYLNLKPPKPYPQGSFLDHPKIHNPFVPSNIPEPKTHHALRNVSSASIIPRPVCKIPTNQLKQITDGLTEHTFDESDSITLERSPSNQPTIAESTHYTNLSFADETLHDEDAWMPILAVANAELDLLNRLENRTITIM